MTEPIEAHGASEATGATTHDQRFIWPQRSLAAWGHRGHALGPAPMAPPGPNGLGPRSSLKNNAGPTGPTANDVPDVVRAVLAGFDAECSQAGNSAEMAPDPLARDLNEERAAIREFDGGQDRAKGEREEWAEVSRASKVIWILHWKDAADEITNPEVWR